MIGLCNRAAESWDPRASPVSIDREQKSVATASMVCERAVRSPLGMESHLMSASVRVTLMALA